MEALDWNWMNFGAMREFPDRELPSFYIKRQVYGNYWFESSRNLRHATEVLPDNIMFETDFPHTTGLNPGAGSFAMPPRDHARQSLEGLPEIVIRKVMYENAASLYAIK
jgi:predicted TIM-barrel fold metal-dependent hydrolase